MILVQGMIYILEWKKIYLWRHNFDDVINFPQNQQFYLIGIFSRTSNRRKLVDASMERYYQDVIKKWWILPHSAYFLLTSALFKHNIQKLRHMTSCDVTMSDLHANFRKCSSSQTYTTLKVWNNSHDLNWNKCNILIFLVKKWKNEKIRIELPKRSNHGRFQVKVCNW